jgi:hypothetical protein
MDAIASRRSMDQQCLNAINEGERERERERGGDGGGERRRKKERERGEAKDGRKNREMGKAGTDKRVQIPDAAMQDYLAAASSDDSASPTTVNFLPPRVK